MGSTLLQCCVNVNVECVKAIGQLVIGQLETKGVKSTAGCQTLQSDIRVFRVWPSMQSESLNCHSRIFSSSHSDSFRLILGIFSF